MTALSPAAEVQRRLWGTDPQAWADLAESHNQPLFEAVLHALFDDWRVPTSVSS